MEWTGDNFTATDDAARLDRDVIRRFLTALDDPATFMELHDPNVYGGA
jgi:hypothetical protein